MRLVGRSTGTARHRDDADDKDDEDHDRFEVEADWRTTPPGPAPRQSGHWQTGAPASWHPDAEASVDAADGGFSPPDPADPPAAHRADPARHAADDAQLAAWMQRIVDHDERALAALYDACMPRVAALVQRIVRRAALTEEVVEDVFWQVWRQAPRFDLARGRVLTWLLAIARSRAIDAWRRNERFCHDEIADDDHLPDTDRAGSADDLLAATRSHAAVQAALQRLDARSRQLVALAFFRGLTHEEIALQAQLPLGTVKSLIRRALAQLRRHLEGQGVLP